ncbi:MAG: serine/threonine protein kinase [Limisphaerales bacterium]|jgi:serine/threonine protein kinase
MEVRLQCVNEECGMVFPVEESFAQRQIPCPNCGGECSPIPISDTTFRHINETLDETRVAAKRYRSYGQIGKGGRGTVVRCKDTTIGRYVAMKVVRTDKLQDDKDRVRFLEEAQITGQLEHPNIVPIHELGQDEDGNLYFTMKLVKGRSLDELIWENKTGQRANSLTQFLSMFLKICDAIAFAHAKGVIHRDLKPANVMIGDFGEVLVMDWGLAKITPGQTTEVQTKQPMQVNRGTIEKGQEVDEKSEDDSVSSIRSQSRVIDTKFGEIQGTPVYMAPEQALGTTNLVDHRSDIYSLGAILYEILTFKRPIESNDLKIVLQQVADGGFPSPEERTPLRKIPAELSKICMKAMEREQNFRYQTVRELEREIVYYVESAAMIKRPHSEDQANAEKATAGTAGWAILSTLSILLISVTAFLVVMKGKVNIIDAKLRQSRSEHAMTLKGNEALLAQFQSSKTNLNTASGELARMAILAEAENQLVDAIRHADAAVRIDPNSPWGHFAWATISVQRNKPEAARGYLKKALAADPEHAESIKLQSELTAPPK